MSKQCHKLQNPLKNTYQLHRNICSSSTLLRSSSSNKDTSSSEDSINNQKKQKSDQYSEKDGEGQPEGFFARFKSELIKDMERDESNRETLNKYREQFEKFNRKYDVYRTTLQKYIPKSQKSESSETIEKADKKHKVYLEKLKSRLDKDQLAKDYEGLKDNLTNKTSQMKQRWEERKLEKAVDPNPEPSQNVDDEKSFVSANMRLKFRELYEKSGISDNPLYQKAVGQTKSLLDAHQDKLSGVSKTASEAVSKSKEFTESVSLKGKQYSESLRDDTKEAVEKLGWQQKSKEALDLSKKALEITEQMAKETAERVAREREELQNSEKFKKVTEATQETLKTAATAAEDFYDTTKLKESETYKSPQQLKKRIEDEEDGVGEKEAEKIKINEKVTGVVEHKGWKWESSWKNFKEQNPLIQKMMEVRETLEESDNIFARAGYKVIDSVHGVFAGMLQPSDISNTIAEIQKMDSEFDINRFSTTLRIDIVPYVIEAYLRSDMEVLESWCQERAMGQFKHMIAAREFRGSIQLIDIGDCDIVAGSMLDLGPVFMFNVSTQQLFRKKRAAAVSGDVTHETEDTIKQVVYTIAVCRDQSMFDATAAWRVLEIIEHVTHEKYF